jgi:tRNA A37 threonylcarbamoyladenosine modification protein TsaB
MILFINTTLLDKLEVRLYNQKAVKIRQRSKKVNYDESEKLLKTIDQVIGKCQQRIKGIIVVNGQQGRFSAIRVGVACANALAWAWNVPVLGIQQGEEIRRAIERINQLKKFQGSVEPVYEKEPNITVRN